MVVSIVIPAYNEAETIGRTVSACLQQDWRDGDIEIVVVDDGSTDDTAVAAERLGAKCIRQTNAGPSAARNAGWRAARGDIICLLDSDCVPNTGWVRRFVTRLEAEGLDGIGGSFSIANPESLLASCAHQDIVRRHAQMGQDAHFLPGGNSCYRRCVLQATGGFKEELRATEDAELAYRARKQGFRLGFDPNNKVAQHYRTSLGGHLRKQFRQAGTRLRVYRDHPNMRRGDGYVRPLDLVQPPLALLTLALIPLVWWPPAAWALALLAAVGLSIHIPSAVFAVRQTRKARFFVLMPWLFLRTFAWALGMVWGVVRLRLEAHKTDADQELEGISP